MLRRLLLPVGWLLLLLGCSDAEERAAFQDAYEAKYRAFHDELVARALALPDTVMNGCDDGAFDPLPETDPFGANPVNADVVAYRTLMDPLAPPDSLARQRYSGVLLRHLQQRLQREPIPTRWEVASAVEDAEKGLKLRYLGIVKMLDYNPGDVPDDIERIPGVSFSPFYEPGFAHVAVYLLDLETSRLRCSFQAEYTSADRIFYSEDDENQTLAESFEAGIRSSVEIRTRFGVYERLAELTGGSFEIEGRTVR